MSEKIFSYVGENCCVQREGSKLIFYPKNSFQGFMLSDDRMREMFYLYAHMLENERLEEIMKVREENEEMEKK